MVVEINPDFKNANFKLGYLETDNNQKIQFYLKVIKNNPKSASAHNNIGVAYENLNK